MPLPKPNKGEKEQEFISRAIAFQKRENPKIDNKQASAIAYSTWRESKKKQMAYELDESFDYEGLVEFFKKNPFPKDDAVHGYAEKLGIDPDELEAQVYALVSTFFSGGMSKGTDITDFDETQLSKGIEVEKEHVAGSEYAEYVAKKIAMDHLTEDPNYYEKLDKMESKKMSYADVVSGYCLADGAAPKQEIMLFPFGQFEHPQYGKLNFDKKFFQQIIDNYNNDVLHTKPFIDVEHQMGKALAWFDSAPYIKEGVGLFAQPVWNEEGKKLLSDRTYRYFSPWYEDFTDAGSGKKYKNVLRGGAVTNIPFIKTMPSIVDDGTSLSESKSVKIMLSDLLYGNESPDNKAEGKPDDADELKGGTDPKNNKGKIMDVLAEIKKRLALAEDASDEDLLAKVEELTKEEKNEEKSEELGEETKGAECKDEEKKMSENKQIKQLSETVARMSMQLLSEKCSRVLDDAIRAAKVKPADRAKWEKRYMSDPEGIKEIIDELPSMVQMSEMGSDYAPIVDNDVDPIVKLSEMASAKAAEKGIEYNAALKVVLSENKDLAKAYTERYRKA